MNLKQYLIGKRKENKRTEKWSDDYIIALDEILADLPQLEKELTEQIGEDMKYVQPRGKERPFREIDIINAEKSRFRTIIHNFFN